MAEEKKEKASAETEINKDDETTSTEEKVIAQKDEAQKAETKKEETQKVENADEKKVTEEKAAEKEVAPEEKVEEKEAAAETEAEEEEPQKAILIGDLNYLPGIRKDLPATKPGDTVRVSYRVIEGGKERTQVFEGVVIAIKNAGVARTITVRKTSFGIAVERIFPLNSKLVQEIEVKKHSKVRRAKLYHLRNLRGKAARLKELR